MLSGILFAAISLVLLTFALRWSCVRSCTGTPPFSARCLVWSLACLLICPVWVQAQSVIPHQYRVVRTTQGQPANTFTFLKAEMTCNLAPGAFAGPGLRVSDPADVTRDCQYLGPGNWAGLPVGIAYQFTIAGANSDGDWGPPSAASSEGVPGAPGGFRLTPGFQGVEVAGVVGELQDAYGLRVAAVDLFGLGHRVYVGALTLSAPEYGDVKVGDLAYVGFARQP